MGRRLSFVNIKGGVGKTTLAVNIAASLARDMDRSVLLVDCDAQSNASIWLMGYKWQGLTKDQTIASIFEPRSSLLASIQKSIVRDSNGHPQIPKLDLLPANNELMDVDAETEGKLPSYMLFYERISALFQDYDYIIFDCPPHLHRMSKCALFSSREVYVPCNPSELSRQGLRLLDRELRRFIQDTGYYANQIQGYRSPRVRGIIINGIEPGVKHDSLNNLKELATTLKRESEIFEKDAFSIDIVHSVLATRAAHRNRPLTIEKGNSTIQENIRILAEWIDSKGDVHGTS